MLRTIIAIVIAIVASTTLETGAVAARRVVDVGIIINPYAGDRAGPEQDVDAKAMTHGGLEVAISENGGRLVDTRTVALTPEEEAQYGRWHRFGLASAHLAAMASENQAAGRLNVGLYNNCSSLMGMLGGLRHSADPPQRVGLVWIDAHGDYNTPETTLSGMLGGMPVAIAAGDALTRMREQAWMDEPIPKDRIVMVGVRDTDPLEQERIERDGIPQVSTADVRSLSENLRARMRELTARSDLVYVHVDLDVLDPSEVSGHPLTVPDGPTGAELGRAIEVMFSYPKTAALGIASYPHDDDPGQLTLKAAHRMIAGAISGMKNR
jgi:arginase